MTRLKRNLLLGATTVTLCFGFVSTLAVATVGSDAYLKGLKNLPAKVWETLNTPERSGWTMDEIEAAEMHGIDCSRQRKNSDFVPQ